MVNLPIGAVALTLLSHYLHENVQRTKHRIDYAGAALILAGAGALIFGLLQGGTAWPWWSAPSTVTFVLCAALIGAAVLVERRAVEPVLPPWIWRSRVLAGSSLAMAGLGLLFIGPSTFLPTYAQTVLGLGPIAAGLVLATTSISWPIAAALSSKLYLRIGFRDTAVIGVALCFVAASSFLLLRFAAPVWQVVAITLVMGAGFGLISTSTIVGVQSTVDWSRRGVVTGASMFSRFLGQSIGAAVYGAVANATLHAQLADAPSSLGNALPTDVNEISDALDGKHNLSNQAADYLRHALNASTHHIYLALALVAVLTGATLLLIVPRRFAVRTSEPHH